VSLLDDLTGLRARTRLLVHLLAAGLLLVGGLGLPWGWASWVASLLGIVWMLNLFNFMDGMDGFAGGMALAGFGFLGWAGHLAGAGSYALYCWMICAACLGFLIFNFPPARIFMGDVGSATLGLLAAALSLWGVRLQLYPAWFPLLVFSPFIVDATVTLLRRALRRERVWQAHREHVYQRLVQAGWGHRRTVLTEYALMAAAGGSGLWALVHPGRVTLVLVVWSIAYVMLMLLAERRCGPAGR
jgi:UDP-N-acetylmuramyl pentapeptide phosphotransferase/UDP-N-acetylglucosamine-1-phosphate transferase